MLKIFTVCIILITPPTHPPHRGEKNTVIGYTTWRGGAGEGVELIYLRTLPQENKKVPLYMVRSSSK